jgi:DNA-binding IclR family transcriptional regulator
MHTAAALSLFILSRTVAFTILNGILPMEQWKSKPVIPLSGYSQASAYHKSVECPDLPSVFLMIKRRSNTSIASSDKKPIKTTSPAVDRAVHILDVIAQSAEPFSLADLARETAFPKSTLHGLCKTLIRLRLIKQLPNGAMTLGPHVMIWANAFPSQTNITQEFHAVWEESEAFPQETVTLSVLDGDDVIYIACHNGSRPLGVTFRIGMRLPAAYTATGKAMLSTLPNKELKEFFANGWPAPLTKASVANLDDLSREIEQCRRIGYSIDNGQTRDGMICFGAPVFNATESRAVAGVAVSFLATEIDSKTRKRIGQKMCALAERLSKKLNAG